MIEHEWYFLHEYWFKKYIRGHRIHNLDLYHIQPLPEGQNIYIVAQIYETYILNIFLSNNRDRFILNLLRYFQQ